jgi:hypothetical protein
MNASIWPCGGSSITNVHISNEGSNNSNNTIVGDNNVIINANFGITINV